MIASGADVGGKVAGGRVADSRVAEVSGATTTRLSEVANLIVAVTEGASKVGVGVSVKTDPMADNTNPPTHRRAIRPLAKKHPNGNLVDFFLIPIILLFSQ
jgi:hypothetical protein